MNIVLSKILPAIVPRIVTTAFYGVQRTFYRFDQYVDVLSTYVPISDIVPIVWYDAGLWYKTHIVGASCRRYVLTRHDPSRNSTTSGLACLATISQNSARVMPIVLQKSTTAALSAI